MEGRTLLKGCAVYRGDGRVREGQTVVVQGPLVEAIAPEAEVAALPGDWVIDCGGRLLRAGLVDCHAHLVNGQVTPIAGADALESFVHRFERRLAMAASLSPLEVEALAAHALAQGLRRGVTLHLEHLLAPSLALQSLEAVARAAERLGARLVLSHASTAFLGDAAGLAQVEANAQLARARKGHPLVRGALGISDSFNASDAMLEKAAAEASALGVGAHFHLCEADDDFALTRGSSGLSVVERLERFGLLRAGNVAAFARRLARDEVAALARSGVAVALAPLAGALEGERDETLEWLLAHGAQVGLGSAGLGTLWEQLPLAFASCAREARGRRLLEPDAAVAELLWGAPSELCSRAFEAPSGAVEPGALADLVVCDTVPAVEDEQSQGLHLLLQVASAPAAWTLVHGKVVVREGQLIGADALELAREAAKAQAAIWRRAG